MQEVENFQLLASTSLASKVADFLYFTWASSDATSHKVVFLASGEAHVNRVNCSVLVASVNEASSTDLDQGDLPNVDEVCQRVT